MNRSTFVFLLCCFSILQATPQDLLLPGTIMQQKFHNGSYKDSLLTEYSFTILDSTQCRTDEITLWTRDINPEVWLERNQMIYHYDDMNRISRLHHLNYSTSKKKWNTTIYYYTYSNNMIRSYYYYQKDYQGFNDKITTYYSYNSENLMTKAETSIYLGKMGYSHPTRKTEFYYDEFGKKQIDSIYNYSVNFYPIQTVKYTYDDSGRVDSVITLPTQYSSMPASLKTHEYDESNHLQRMTIFKLNTSWIPNVLVEYVYDSTYTRRIFEIQKTWNPNTASWTDSGRIKNEEFCTDELLPTLATEQPLFRLYPNPGNELRLLALSDIRNLNTITVMDIRGVVILSDQFQWPHLDILQERSRGIPNGFYFVSITSENYRQDLKWIKSE